MTLSLPHLQPPPTISPSPPPLQVLIFKFSERGRGAIVPLSTLSPTQPSFNPVSDPSNHLSTLSLTLPTIFQPRLQPNHLSTLSLTLSTIFQPHLLPFQPSFPQIFSVYYCLVHLSAQNFRSPCAGERERCPREGILCATMFCSSVCPRTKRSGVEGSKSTSPSTGQLVSQSGCCCHTYAF